MKIICDAGLSRGVPRISDEVGEGGPNLMSL